MILRNVLVALSVLLAFAGCTYKKESWTVPVTGTISSDHVTYTNKILTIDAASVASITPFLGHKVSITGKVEGTTVKVDTITGLKLQ